MDNDKSRAKSPHSKRSARAIIATLLIGFFAGLAGSYVMVSSGLVTPGSQTISNNRDTVVVQEGEVVADVATKASPSAVSITTQSLSQRQSMFGPSVQQGAGSGIIISKDGYVLTNKHVVPEGTTRVTVVAADGTRYDNVSVIGRDAINDLAFLRIKGVTNLTPLAIGDSTSVKVGQKVIAIGNALGEFQNTVTLGIISGIGRPIQASSDGSGSGAESLENLFQTDAAINPGNSGGPLLNLQGEIIGINTAVAQDAQGIGFAIPINDARGLIRSVLETGKVTRGLLGVRYVAIDNQLAKQRKLPTTEGALLRGGEGAAAVIPGSGAAKAGLKDGDIIIKVNDDRITSGNSLAGLLGQYKPGEVVTLTILRDGKEMTVQATLQAP